MAGLISLFSSAAYSQQSDAGYDWRDSSKIPTKLLPQHSEFLNNAYPYPSRPRDQWELGLHAGHSFIIGDVSPRPGFGGGISLRKSLGHTFSLRGDYTGSFNYGLDYRPRTNAQLPGNVANNPWAGYGNNNFVANYRNALHQGNLDLIAVLNNRSHYRGNPKTNFYALTGYSVLIADVDVDAVGANGQPYNFNNFNFARPRADIKDDLKNLMNMDYESNAGALNGNRANVGRIKNNQLVRHAFSAGAGFALKLSRTINLALEQRFTFTFDDNMDGLYVGRSNDVISYTSGRLNINLGNRARRVEPLWWINPNNFIYNELNRPSHMKLPTPVLPDADGDGVTDQFDMEPNTPAGVPVDARGVARDTDGDGVPDYKDKELLTPQRCFPVDADGVGNCPEAACCKEIRDMLESGEFGRRGACNIGNLPSIQFASGGATLTNNHRNILNSAAAQIKADPTCKIRVTGHAASDKRSQQLSWDRVNAVIRYLVERQGISQDRFIFTYGEQGDPNTVDLMGTTEEGPNTVPAPHPQYRRG
ncbi:OmpA family protein [Aridibaculum aurantiacum]|uniref:OmpA family protein n=1 Tax=Aridibaculum aurantiacum TaxID=2810307 RepID=UPI001A97ACAB|nr:OmpA family protein [Aridibaculum aurantiacum]